MGVKERKERERQQRCNGILEAARRIFETKGFLNTTLQDVAKEAEISVGLIYRYFQSKEDIFASLALKGALTFDRKVDHILKRTDTRKKATVSVVFGEIADAFFEFYSPYGEYFDMLLYSYRGLKKVQIQGATLTRLMRVTLLSLDRVKTFILSSSQFRASGEDEALEIVFLLWAVLLGCHKLFEGTGRGHLFAYAYEKEKFIPRLIDKVLSGISVSSPSGTMALKRGIEHQPPLGGTA